MTLPNMQTSPALANALADTTRESASHVRAALETLPEPASLHYTNPADFDRAVAEHRERLRQLQAIVDDLDTLARHLEPAAVCPHCGTVGKWHRLDCPKRAK